MARKYYCRLFKKKVTVLKNIFKRISCNRLTKEYFIKAIIDDDILVNAFRVSNIDENILC